ncbi:hypothetical protein QBC43DRAFT_6855 [Cladorrhinum sp. PSN259]|nr:hypothetical protein QBC43DRAFT_6855 [Cladorrhinum sp. PSN259]
MSSTQHLHFAYQSQQCDGKTPCTQCLFRGLECPGYPSTWTFVQNNSDTKISIAKTVSPSKRKGHALIDPSKPRGRLRTRKSVVEATAPEALSLDYLIDTIVQGYVPGQNVAASIDETTPRICGAWAEVLPDLVRIEANPVLVAAIKAFALSIRVGGPKPAIDKPTAVEAYSSALRSVNDALQTPASSSTTELVAAVMCLLFAELFLPTSLESWTAHLEGLGDLIQTCQPQAYASGIAHRLFVGARPALIVLGIQSRRPCFLALDQWRRVPFQEITPSPVQALMGEAAIIPKILENLDKRGDLDREMAKVTSGKTLTGLLALLERLESWAVDFRSSSEAPPFWCEPAGGVYGRGRIWFKDLTAANGFTHFWAFKVICLINIERLLASYPEFTANVRLPEPCVFDETKKLSIMMCQSIEYLMQGDMKLFGPTSVVLPLQTAYETFRAGGDQTKSELDWCREILKDVFRGYHFLTLFFDEYRVQF